MLGANKSKREIKDKFLEAEANLSVLSNLISKYKDIQVLQADELLRKLLGDNAQRYQMNMSKLETLVDKTIKTVKDLNAEMYSQVNNPYLKLFFLVMQLSSQSNDEICKKILDLKIDFFDLITVMLRFLDMRTLL